MTPRHCPECGVEFTPHHGRQMFCAPPHKSAFENRCRQRGLTLLPLLLVWRRGGDGRRTPTDASRFAYREACALMDRYNAEDREAGRRSDVVVNRKHDMQWRAVDLD